jgi:hypothetical protein
MPRAVVLTTQSKANLTGGTFADTLSANTNDSTSVVNYDSGEAWIREMWGIDSDSVMEGELIYTRPESTHDQSHGFRFMIPAIALGGAATNASFNILPGRDGIKVFKSDTGTINVSGTAADDVLVSYTIEYDDMPGVQAVFASWDQVQSMRVSDLGLRCDAVASATPGAYGASRSFTADDSGRLHANTWYALLGASVQTQVTTISLLGADWGGQRIGFPAGALDLNSNQWFLDQTVKWGRPFIPCFNSNNAAGINVVVADGEASTSPKIDFRLVELSGKPGA